MLQPKHELERTILEEFEFMGTLLKSEYKNTQGYVNYYKLSHSIQQMKSPYISFIEWLYDLFYQES